MQVLERARSTIRRHQLMSPDTRVLVALSGGSDSVALTHVMRALHDASALQLVGLAHFNHQLRDAAADDERFCAAMAAALGLPFAADCADVAARARQDRISLETAGRTARHAFLERARLDLGADVIAVGHTRDDQAETFLLRLLRGAGSKGLSSMHPRAGRIVRPLLECRRAELRQFLADAGIPFVEDASNADVEIPRNRVRAELLPLLEARFNPRIVDALASEAALARDEHAFLAGEVERFWTQHVREGPHGRVFDAAALTRAPRAIARLAMHRAMTEVASGRSIRLADVERSLDLLNGPDGSLDAPGQRVQRIGAAVVLRSRPAGETGSRPASPPANLFTYSLSIPGEVAVPEASCVVSTELRSSWRGDFRRLSSGTSQAVVQMGAVELGAASGALAVRSRRPGDRFRPLGLGGCKKLQDFFVDRKVVREARDRVPIVVDGAGRIVWVAGHAIDEAFRVTDPAQAVIILRLKGLGGSA